MCLESAPTAPGTRHALSEGPPANLAVAAAPCLPRACAGLGPRRQERGRQGLPWRSDGTPGEHEGESHSKVVRVEVHPTSPWSSEGRGGPLGQSWGGRNTPGRAGWRRRTPGTQPGVVPAHGLPASGQSSRKPLPSHQFYSLRVIQLFNVYKHLQCTRNQGAFPHSYIQERNFWLDHCRSSTAGSEDEGRRDGKSCGRLLCAPAISPPQS